MRPVLPTEAGRMIGGAAGNLPEVAVQEVRMNVGIGAADVRQMVGLKCHEIPSLKAAQAYRYPALET
jgi:hypothetical protein